ncbi:uncharacterized protein ARMOST_15563 [Armillaria ostoyae]|uniref:Uncharacterized protein n=1 Tax=Armillaria ostoyae TaxID=47428 RepID=A0A284RTU7_ARMOS|nr:uncharacterized protein ARMOST_15563 [Armillaria ostoyae]
MRGKWKVSRNNGLHDATCSSLLFECQASSFKIGGAPFRSSVLICLTDVISKAQRRNIRNRESHFGEKKTYSKMGSRN